MNYLKVARLNQISIDLDGQSIPVSDLAFKEPKANITISDDVAGRLKVSLIKEHNGVLLLRAERRDQAHLVFCINRGLIAGATANCTHANESIMESGNHALGN